ncbi:MAG: hypothetical protein IKU37_07335 [Candidatus Gastranaerophilales bacterium]|nr:hypothetical protein [Candidatus Gastranaerophilales bacterium]
MPYKILTGLQKNPCFAPLAQNGDILQTAKKIDLPALFSSNPTSLKFKKEVREMISALPWEQKMIHQRGGQWQAYPRFNYNGSFYCINRFVHSPKGYTNGLDDCIAVLLHNDDDAFLYHLAPGSHKNKIAIEDMQKGLQETIAKLGAGGKECSVVLVGGSNTDGSQALYENISDVLKKNKIEAQEVLFGDGHKSIYYDLNKGIMICDGLFDDVKDLKREFGKVRLLNTETFDP